MTGIRTPRGRRATSAALAALAAVSVLAWGAAEAIFLAMHRRTFWLAAPDVARYGRRTLVGDLDMLAVGVGVFLLGLVLFGAAVIPPRRRLIELTEPDPALAVALTRGSFRHTLAAAATAVDGVSEATVTGHRRLRITASTPLRDADEIPDRVRERVLEQLTRLDQPAPRSIRVTLEKLDG